MGLPEITRERERGRTGGQRLGPPVGSFIRWSAGYPVGFAAAVSTRQKLRSQRLVNLRFGFSVKFESRSDTSSSVWFMLGSLGSEFRVQHQALEWVSIQVSFQFKR
ncbi:hypothetical protein HanXRQr2_Chr11g0506731 [Helianthus annuus]|uniref:Uncharacterized protein n=1 Tax=Helianthus annuus TaxID=4232 RepID=A0A251TFA9_HELAN|nr:hypothetical protein HanXRQr2_Chr11g0506721 [Helianthus annuus]KAF5783334.1 hypothetical protein HanXRQr2_Chr11g0506731 [Helianthus annuus]KAJ0876427.1 hypothetical protein HanPSC8_Chr11g0488331 [Helianthus annuus]KAJ0876428.1 hypothetical protein HanPSC8_Chr11g0488351 [Helianthus annuus]